MTVKTLLPFNHTVSGPKDFADAVMIVDANGIPITSFGGGGGGGGGDATAANQNTQTSRLTEIRDRLVQSGGRLVVDGSGVTQPVSFATLPLPSGAATSAKQPNFGTAGTPSADVITIQGSVGMTPIRVDFSSAGTQPVSLASIPLATNAAIASKQPAFGSSGTASVDVLTIQGISGMIPLRVDGSANTQPISASSLPLPSGAATSAKQPALGTPGSASSEVITVQGVASMTPLRVDGSASTQPISATSLPLPSGAATSSNQTILLNALNWTSSSLTALSSSFTNVNGTEKLFVVPANTDWQLLSFYIDLVSSGAAGNRQLAVRVEDTNSIVFMRVPAGAIQTASQTRRYSFGIGLPDLQSFRDVDKLLIPLPPLVISTGFRIRILDSAAIDTTNDTLTVRGLIMQRTF